MRIVVDVQGAQSLNRARGIGRASVELVHALARCAGANELWLLANGALTESLADFEALLGDAVPLERTRVFDVPGDVREAAPANRWRARAGELSREAFLQDLRPDAVVVTSLFEGLHDNAVASIGSLATGCRTAAVLYDLIPLTYPDIYIPDAQSKRWYFRKLQSLKKAGMLLAISEHSARDAIERLGVAEERVRTIPLAADRRFRPVTIAADAAKTLLGRYRIERPFVMCTGGIDHRKNIERLIEAFAMLKARTDDRYQLVIVCACSDNDRYRLEALARQHGLPENRLVLTGYISDDELVALYNLAALFVFPSLAEGFGLPVLEAMACGTPVIASNSTSLPELVGHAEALFDPASAPAISDKLHQVLADTDLRRHLGEHGLKRSACFSWDTTGQIALEALERMAHVAGNSKAGASFVRQTRPRLAFVSPLPPDRSGVADYSAELLRELATYYDIELVNANAAIADDWLAANFPLRSIAWFEANAKRFDRIVYQVGNSVFHLHMFDLLSRFPGTVVLHDFFLGDTIHWAVHMRLLSGDAFLRTLYRSHGYRALIAYYERGEAEAPTVFPANREILEAAQGVIVHSRHALLEARHWYGEGLCSDWAIIPQLRRVASGMPRVEARERLGLGADDFVVCSFGHVSPTKMVDRLLSAWRMSSLAQRRDCVLVVVGEGDGPYFQDLVSKTESADAPGRFRVTGRVSTDDYNTWLAAADVAVQLRTRSRGETSRAVLDALASGCPVIFNAHGSAAELPADVGVRLADGFSDEDLAAALEDCHERPDLQAVGHAGRDYVQRVCGPAQVGALYRDAIERFAAEHRLAKQRVLVEAIANIPSDAPPPASDLVALARVMARHRRISATTVFVGLPSEAVGNMAEMLAWLIKSTPINMRVEPVVLRDKEMRSAHRLTSQLLKLGRPLVADELVEMGVGDYLVCLGREGEGQWADVTRHLRLRGVAVHFMDPAMVVSDGQSTVPERKARAAQWFADIGIALSTS